MLIKKSEAKKFQHNEACSVWEYEDLSPKFSFATAEINGRYPEEKRVCNTACEEIYFVQSGYGIIHSARWDFAITQGDVYLFEKDEIYWVEGRELLLVLVNIPKWTPEQHKSVE